MHTWARELQGTRTNREKCFVRRQWWHWPKCVPRTRAPRPVTYLPVTWAAVDSRQIQHLGSQQPLVSSFLLDQAREDMTLTGENWTHASPFVTGVWGCATFPSPLRDSLSPFDVDRGSYEWGGECEGSGKWESFQALISSEVTLPVLPSSAGTHTFRKQSKKAAVNDLADMASCPLNALGSAPCSRGCVVWVQGFASKTIFSLPR